MLEINTWLGIYLDLDIILFLTAVSIYLKPSICYLDDGFGQVLEDT